MDMLITLANLVYVLSYFVQDLLRLRLLTIVGAGILAGYFLLRPEPIMAVVYWNSFFILLNGAQVARILYQRHSGRDPLVGAIAACRAWIRRASLRIPGGSSCCATS